MNATEISSVVKDGDLIAIAVLVGLAAVPMIKGIFALSATRRQRRKEFLELWKADSLDSSGLWLEEVILHRYGAAIPAELICHVSRLSWPSKKLRRLAMSAGFLRMDEMGQAVTWSKTHRTRAFWLELEMVASVVAYVVLAALGTALLITGVRQGLAEGFAALASGGLIASAGCASFMHFISLNEARSSLSVVNGIPHEGLWARLKSKRSR